MTKLRLEWIEACPSCKSTGLYVGMGERAGAAVVCTSCKGTGRLKRSHEYDEFTERKPRLDVKRVYQTGAGIVLSPEVVPGGVTYEAWVEDPDSVDRRGNEPRGHTCPAWWRQATGKPDMRWDECQSAWGRGFSSCEHFSSKEKCWARFDAESDAGFPGVPAH